TAAQDRAVSPALTPLGGGSSMVNPSENQKDQLVVPEFRARVVLDDMGDLVPGQRAYVRFKLEKKSLIWQWGRRFWQLIEAKGASAKWL
ncbi:MAG TPA: hypothetical protein VN541_00590, partial [Tepidisphaeraceae bacterium]|nr:hypothetical protein [Tepidisphaeraceae bacterium]